MSQVDDRWASSIAAARAEYRLPRQAGDLADAITSRALALLFPHFITDHRPDRTAVRDEIRGLEATLGQFLSALGTENERIAAAFIDALPGIHDALVQDATATFDADPAARSVDEVILAYPGFYATACHRLAHALWLEGVPLLARLISESAHRRTGIDIHPGASIGRAFAIDHGTGIVIGETAVIGDRVRLYQGVTLGALSVTKNMAETRRHPTIEHSVVVYANATILGGDTVVGHSSVIGGNVWLTHSVPPYSIVTNRAASERRTVEARPPFQATA